MFVIKSEACKAVVKPGLTEANKTARKEYALKMMNDKESRDRIVYFDEKNFNFKPTNNVTLIRRKKGEAFEEKNIVHNKRPSSNTACNIGIFIGAFGKGELFLCENDLLWDSDGNRLRNLSDLKSQDPVLYKFEGEGFNNRAYLNLLDKKILPSIKQFTNNFIYMHDNSPVHVAKYRNTRTEVDVFNAHNVSYITDWPPNSPDMNPVEKVLAYLQIEYFKHIERMIHKPKNKKDVFEQLKIVWANLDNDRVIKTFLNGEHVLPKVIEVGGSNNFKS